MSLLEDIRKSTQALSVQSTKIKVVGNNIAHVNDKGYARQTADIGSLGTVATVYGAESLGVGITELRNARDQVIDEQIMESKMTTGSLGGQKKFARNIEVYFENEVASLGKEVGDGLSASIAQLFGAFSGLASSSSTSEKDLQKTVVFGSASRLVDGLHTLDGNLARIDANISTQIDSDIKEANAILDKIARMNFQISRVELGGNRKALEERDERQKAFEELAKFVNFEVKQIGSTAGEIQIVTKDSSSSDVIMLDKKQVLRKFAYDGTNITTDDTTPITLGLSGGALYGYLNLRTNTLSGIRTKLDNLADQLVTSVNTAYNPTAATGDFFNVGGTTAATIALDGTITSGAPIKTTDTAEEGANELANAVGNLVKTQFSTGSGDSIDGTYSEFYTGVVLGVGQDVNVINQKYRDQLKSEESLMNMRDSVSGVSIDEEIADLLILQKSFGATSKYIVVANGLLDIITRELLR